MEARSIRLLTGEAVLVDEQDYRWLKWFSWFGKRTPRGDVYAACIGTFATVLMHRVIVDAPKGSICDHVDGNTLNNCRCNLRLATAVQNARNTRKKIRYNTTSKYKGVSLSRDPWRKQFVWRAAIRINEKRKHLGYFKTEEEAAIAYNEAAKVHFREFARLNNVTIVGPQ